MTLYEHIVDAGKVLLALDAMVPHVPCEDVLEVADALFALSSYYHRLMLFYREGYFLDAERTVDEIIERLYESLPGATE